MLRLSKLTDYATVVMTALAQHPQTVLTASEIARRTHIGEPTVRKTLKQLAGHELLVSQRGAHGGYRLARAPAEISVADIIAAIEGPLALTECAQAESHCAIQNLCALRGHWQVINSAIADTLRRLSLSDMAAPLSRQHLVA